MIAVRDALASDADAINAIYNHEVEHGTATFDTEPITHQRRLQWLATHGPRHPVLVAERSGVVAGWASLSPWSPRRAYDRTAEVSVYVSPDHRGAGVGRQLLAELIDRARVVGLAVLIARIAGPGEASSRLHRAAGFEPVGLMRRVGEKFGRLIDVEILDLHLDTELP